MGLVGKLADLVLVDKQLARATWLVVPLVCLRVLRDVASHQPELPVTDPSVSFLQGDLPISQALDLAPDQLDPALQGLQHIKTMASLAILGDRALVRRLVLGFFLFLASHGSTPEGGIPPLVFFTIP